MKKLFFLLSPALFLFACSSGKSDKKTGTADSTGAVTVTEKKIVRLDPVAIDVNNPLDAITANEQINCWDEKKIEVAGYGYVFYGDSLETKSGLVLTDSMGSNKKLIDCRFVGAPTVQKISKTDLIHIRGRIRGNFLGTINLDSCEIVSVSKSVPTQPVDPFGSPVMDARELSADYFKWDGKEISIVGDYYMTTVSTTKSGKSIRVDLKNSATNDKVAGCDFKEDPTDKIRVNEKGVIIKGRIKTYTPYGYLMLEDCSLVNR